MRTIQNLSEIARMTARGTIAILDVSIDTLNKAFDNGASAGDYMNSINVPKSERKKYRKLLRATIVAKMKLQLDDPKAKYPFAIPTRVNGQTWQTTNVLNREQLIAFLNAFSSQGEELAESYKATK